MAIEQDEPGPVFDEDFVRGAVFTEPSAKERARKPRKPSKPPRDPDAPRSGRSAVLQVLVAVVVLLAISTGLWWVNRPDPAKGTTPSAPPAAGSRPSNQVDPRRPFAGSPAADYAEGEKGLAIPEPKAVGTVGRADMARAYERVKTILVTANLDPRVVHRRATAPFLETLDAEQRPDFRKRITKAGENGLRGWLTSFAPGVVSASDVVKVRGEVTAVPSTEDGRRGVLVRTAHLFVYAVRPAGPSSDVMRVVVRRTNEILVWRENGRLRVWGKSSRIEPAPVDCDAPDDDLVHPDPRGESSTTGTPVDPYDLSRKRPADDDTCGRVTRV